MANQYTTGSSNAKQQGSYESLRLEPETRPKCNDAFFAWLFLGQLVVLVIFGVWKGPHLLHNFNSAVNGDDGGDDHKISYAKIFALMAGLIGTGIAVATIWINVLLAFAEHMIRAALWMNVGFMVGMGISSALVNPFMPFVFAIFALINVCYIYAVQNRIAFASANLKIASTAVHKYKSILLIPVLMMIVGIVLFAIWGMGALGIYQFAREHDAHCKEIEEHGGMCGGGGMTVALVLLLIALYWGQQVTSNVVVTTTSGTVASWWYSSNPPNVVSGALYRSMTTSFGSICYGSLIVAILQALDTIARSLQDKAREDNNAGLACLACLADCILNCLQSIMQYFNKWAYVYVGIYGYDFRTSGKAVMDLFRHRGWTAVINDDLTGSAMALGSFGVALLTAGAGLLIAAVAPEAWTHPLGSEYGKYLVFGLFGFFIGMSMALVLSAVISTALSTVFVCFAEDPAALRATHTQEHNDLVSAWKQFHPDAWVVAYGTYA